MKPQEVLYNDVFAEVVTRVRSAGMLDDYAITRLSVLAPIVDGMAQVLTSIDAKQSAELVNKVNELVAAVNYLLAKTHVVMYDTMPPQPETLISPLT